MLKRPSSKAAASGDRTRTLWGARCDEYGAPRLCTPPSGEAAGSPLKGQSETRTMLGTRRVSDFGELSRAAHWGWAGEKGNFVSILLKNHCPLRSIAKRAMVTHLGQYLYLLLNHQNLAADMSRMQMTAIGQCVPLSCVEHIAGGNPNVLRFTRLQNHFSFHDKR
jgi:hypothetical protein